MEKTKVIIIGAGPAGLMAGYELLKEKGKYDVLILEQSNQIGGISKTIKYNENRMDIGGHRFFSKNDKVMNFWKEIMPIQGAPSYDDKKLEIEKPLAKNGPDPEKEDKVMLVRHRVSRIYYMKKFFDYPISMNIETLKNIGFLNTMKAGFSYTKAMIFKRKEVTLEDFFINRFGKVLYQMFFEKYTEKVWGRHPSKISADWGKQRVKGVSISAVLKDSIKKIFGKKDNEKVETSLIEQFWYPKYGPGQLWETLAKKIEEMGGAIKKDCTVEKLNIKNSKIISVQDNKNEIIEADIIISTMPLKSLVQNLEGEEIPKEILDIAKGLPYVDFMTVGLLVDKINLENKTKIKTLGNIVPDNWIYVQEPEVKMCRIQIFNNWSPYMVKNPENTIWMGLEYMCKKDDMYWKMTDEEFINFATEELIKINLLDKQDIKDAHVERIEKAYPAYFDTYSQIQKLIEFLNKYSNLYCIGRNGQHRYNNMDHSMLTAIEATNNIKSGITDKSNIWNVNAEKEYHETK